MKTARAQPLDSAATLHLRCGSDIREALGLAGFAGPFLAFADPFCQGPVPRLPPAAFIETRARFVADAYGLDPQAAQVRMQREYAALETVRDRAHVVLWFEHDAYDQLILAFLLDFFAQERGPERLELVCVDAVPGVARFTGLGQLPPEALAKLWAEQRVPVTDAHTTLGQRVWDALREPDPAPLFGIARAGTEPVAPMANAIRRHLQELPSTRTGLSLTQELTLALVAERGPLTGAELFRALADEREPLPFLGDLMFWHVLRELSDVSEPLFEVAPESAAAPWPGRRLRVADAGTRVLAGEASYLDLSPAPRWVGGIEITAGRPGPRWDPSAGLPV